MIFAVALALSLTTVAQSSEPTDAGQLSFRKKSGESVYCPLKGTQVDAEIEGFCARVTMVQTFRNSSSTPVEAIYTFPMPHEAAVDRMRIEVDRRVIEGVLRSREDARDAYQRAKSMGQTAALLDQENTSIFTQSIANLEPNATVRVEISYVQMLKYEGGEFEFTFPMTVGPRYIGASTPNPSRIAPPYQVRSGANIDLHVRLDAGAPIQKLESVLHRVETKTLSDWVTEVKLAKTETIPNRDFILKYRVAGDAIGSSFVSHYDPERGGFFSLVVMPPTVARAEQVAPKELVFVMDQSGSQEGFPLEKSKELTLKLIDRMGPQDTFNVMGFSNDVTPLWPSPRPNTEANRAEAKAFVQRMEVTGGTELQKAVVAALAPARDPKRIRYVVFNTDGFVGQEKAVLDNVRQYRNNGRMFVFGIGDSVNRGLIDAMSTEGSGDCEVVTLASRADEAVDRFVGRTGNPVLSDISVSSEDLVDTQPDPLPDVLEGKPLVVFGRYTKSGPAAITLRGQTPAGEWTKTVRVNLSARTEDSDAVMRLWAGRRLRQLERKQFEVRQDGEANDATRAKLTRFALDYGILSPYTSLVAVDKRVVNIGGRQRTVRVPINLPHGMSGGGNLVPDSIDFISYDPSDHSLVTRGGGGAAGGLMGGFGGGGFGGGSLSGRSVPSTPPTSTKREGDAYDPLVTKVPTSLRKAEGIVAIQVFLSDLSGSTLAKLHDLGFVQEGQLDDVKVVFGTIDAKRMRELATLNEVRSVERDE